ncbi:MAG: PaaI family thioesterase [Pseudomonadota bacterium]
MSRADDLARFWASLPIVETLGMRVDIKGDDLTAVLPYQEKLIGNFAIKALHGGAIATFLELAAMAQLYIATDGIAPPRTINVTIDYLRQAHAQDLYARSTITKLGRRVASVRAEAWQAKRDKPVAAIMAHFQIKSLDDLAG